jgi:hypothetical protein
MIMTQKQGPAGSKKLADSEGDAGATTATVGLPARAALLLGALGCYLSFFSESVSAPTLRAAFSSSGEDLTTEFGYSMVFFLACLGLVSAFDIFVARLFVGRWFALHALVNAIIVAWSARDAFGFFSLPNAYLGCTCVSEGVRCASHAPLCLSLALHVWHGLAYPLKPIDWVHHVPNWTLTAMCIYYQWGPMQGFSLFWALMGVPGMIDYALLVGVKQQWLPAATEKSVNERLNVWMRAPFCAISAFVMFESLFMHPETFVDRTQMVVQGLNAVHCAWNGQFFMARTVEARTRFDLAQKAAKQDGKHGGTHGGVPGNSQGPKVAYPVGAAAEAKEK